MFKKLILENQVYFLLLFLSLVLGIFSYLNRDYLGISPLEEAFKGEISQYENISSEGFVKNIEQNIQISYLLKITFFVGFLFFIMGVYFCFSFLFALFRGKVTLFSQDFPAVNWQILDIFRVVIVIIFFTSFLKVIEPIFFRIFGINIFVRFMLHVLLFDIFCLGLIIYFVYQKHRSTLISLGLGLSNFINNILLAFLHYLGVIPLLFLSIFFSFSFTQLFKYKPEISPLFYFFFLPQPKLLIFFTTIFIAIIGPVIEEIFFRGFCYPALRSKIGPLKAMVLVSLFFALLHMNVIGFLPIFTLGLLLVYLYEKTHSLFSSIGVHIIHNSLILYLVFLYRALLLK
ncbi:MAG: CPBP family intramembrane metalloprotease [Candidatus Omnitrophica bacterium]|nr:CPBP family intramembrane metalloprotease [Candidatus Omnitrophota bacterium]